MRQGIFSSYDIQHKDNEILVFITVDPDNATLSIRDIMFHVIELGYYEKPVIVLTDAFELLCTYDPIKEHVTTGYSEWAMAYHCDMFNRKLFSRSLLFSHRTILPNQTPRSVYDRLVNDIVGLCLTHVQTLSVLQGEGSL